MIVLLIVRRVPIVKAIHHGQMFICIRGISKKSRVHVTVAHVMSQLPTDVPVVIINKPQHYRQLVIVDFVLDASNVLMQMVFILTKT